MKFFWWVCYVLTNIHKKLGLLGLLHTTKEFPKDLYDVINMLTVILDVNNSGIFSHMSLSHRGTLRKTFLFFISIYE